MRSQLDFSHAVSLTQFTPEGRLFVVTNDQTAFLVDVSSKSKLAAEK